MADENAEYRPSPADCPTCNGWLLVNGGWVARRETVGMVCPSCGHDYAEVPDGE